MTSSPRSLGSGFDRRDLDRRQLLTVAVLADVVLAEAELEDDELVAERVLDDLARHLRAGDGRLADRHLAAVAARHEEDLVERDLVSGVAVELLDHDGLARLDSVLLSTRLDHGVHGFGLRSRFRNRGLYSWRVARQDDRAGSTIRPSAITTVRALSRSTKPAS